MKDYASKKPPQGKTAFRMPQLLIFKRFFETLKAKERIYLLQRKFANKFDQFRFRFKKK